MFGCLNEADSRWFGGADSIVESLR